MTPEQLAKSGSEHAEQMALFAWANMAARLGFEAADDMRAYGTGARGAEPSFPLRPVPSLRWLHAIPNAGARSNKVAAAQLKAEGVKAGVADVFLPVPIRLKAPLGMTVPVLYCGLYIEMKRADGRLSDVSQEQKTFAEFVTGQGYAWNVCFGWRKATETIKLYLAGERIS